MAQKTLVVFEGERVCPQATTYAREYCLRMDLEVGLLMLVVLSTSDWRSLAAKRLDVRRLERRVGQQLASLAGEFLREGIEVSTALRVGDPAAELLRFLAGRPPFRTIIWGSDAHLPDAGSRGQSHWLAAVLDRLDCPLFAVSHRPSPATPPKSDKGRPK